MDSYKRTRNNSTVPKTLLLFSLICLLFLFTTPIPAVFPDPSGLHAAPTDARQAETMVTGRLRINPSKRSGDPGTSSARAQFSYPLDERLNRQIASTDTRCDATARPTTPSGPLHPDF